MLPTPDTSHVPYSRVYEPAEDSFLLLDTLSSPAETAFLQSRFGHSGSSSSPESSGGGGGAPLVVEIGPGSGVVLAFLVAQARHLFGAEAGGGVLALGVDVNAFACAATGETVRRAVEDARKEEEGKEGGAKTGTATGTYLGCVTGDLVSPLRPGTVDVLVFNPPYVPTDELPALPTAAAAAPDTNSATPTAAASPPTAQQDPFARDAHLLALAYAGGRDGMETTGRLLDALLAPSPSANPLSARGCAYVLLCAQNRPEEVKARMRAGGWRAETVGSSGRRAGWEVLQIVRFWRDVEG